jgi:osmotically-inducible protein OsmY
VVAKDVMAAIDRDILVDPEDVTVEVTDGIVSLSGTVAGWTSRSAAEADAARTSGVIDVYNDLKIAY